MKDKIAIAFGAILLFGLIKVAGFIGLFVFVCVAYAYDKYMKGEK